MEHDIELRHTLWNELEYLATSTNSMHSLRSCSASSILDAIDIVAAVVMVVFGEVVVGGIGGGYAVGSAVGAVGCCWCYSPRAAWPTMTHKIQIPIQNLKQP